MNWVKYAAIAIAPLVLIWGIWTFLRSNQDPLPGSLPYVDVMSGEVVYFQLNTVKSIPARNAFGERVLLPAEERDGKFYVQEHYRGALERMKADARFKVDLNTLEVKGAN